MANMSYCRFENTASDLQDCFDHWDETPDEQLSSDHERRGKKRLKKIILEFADMFGWIDDNETENDD
jgi:hypothetical protein